MQNLEKIIELEYQLTDLVTEEIAKLESIDLVPQNLSEQDDEFYDWFSVLPIVKYEEDNYYITRIKKTTKYGLLLDGRNVDDLKCDMEFSVHELSLLKKISLLKCVRDIKEHNEKISQTI